MKAPGFWFSIADQKLIRLLVIMKPGMNIMPLLEAVWSYVVLIHHHSVHILWNYVVGVALLPLLIWKVSTSMLVLKRIFTVSYFHWLGLGCISAPSHALVCLSSCPDPSTLPIYPIHIKALLTSTLENEAADSSKMLVTTHKTAEVVCSV